MTNVVLYIRVSTDEQAEKGFSLPAQEEALFKYAAKKKYNVLKVFKDDFSAWKGFDRPGYKEFKSYLNQNKQKVDKLLFTQWSRFSRNTAESYAEISNLSKLGVTVLPIEQETDNTIPENLILHAINLALPQVENERLAQRVKSGIRQALKQGRFQNKAPFGYKNNTLTKLIEVDNEKAELVREAFDLMATFNYTMEDVRMLLKEKGLKLAKQSFISMLKNITYTGKIRIKSFKDEPENIIYGLHEPIVDEEVFGVVQSIINGKKKPYKGLTKSENLPLVGYLCCPICNKQMTGSASHGNGGMYHYYHCQRKYGCNNAFNAIKANAIFQKYLDSLIPEKSVVELYHAILQDVFKSNNSDREVEIKKLELEIVLIEERINTAVEKNLDGVWDDKTFTSAKLRLETKLDELKMRVVTLKTMPNEFSSYLNFSTSLIADIGGYYKNADTKTKKKIIGSIFPEKVYFDGSKYRTTKVNQVFELIYNASKGLNKKSLAKNARLSRLAPPV